MCEQKKYNLWEIRNGFAYKTTGAKPRKPIAKKSAKKIKQEQKDRLLLNGEDTELQKWYEVIMTKENGRCWETKEWIDKFEDIIVDGEIVRTEFASGWHGSIAHVLPKSLFPSVATHPQNYIILKMWGGTHGQYDSSWSNASKMKVWRHCCKIFNLLYPLLTIQEKAKLPDIIMQEILIK